ncbi:MAG: YdiU family protein [Hyphomicrobiaceae bacterium]|nr:YdiU family protein [Hyphomicrobiaceae bacterium]
MTIEPPRKAFFPFDNSYARLPDRFYARLTPTPVATPRLIRLNEGLAAELGLDPAALSGADGVAVLAGNSVSPGSEPIAQAYAGHQFGGFVPQLGDGRAILLGEVVDRQGRRRDIQLKGSGPTPFSRRGDGRAALGPVLREYIVSEAMAALGIPTTRALAAVVTGEYVFREEALPGAVLTRVAASHIRVGTFQYFAARQDLDGIRTLADHVIARHYPEAAAAVSPYRALLDGVIARQAGLVARWLGVGFIHGVMNTDNTTVSGETIDYGPCAFMDAYHPSRVLSSIDTQGRYAYANQPQMAQWNLARLAECLLPLLGDDEAAQMSSATSALTAFAGLFEDAYTAVLRAKLGLAEAREGDLELAHDLLDRMTRGKADMTLTFRRLADAAADAAADASVEALFEDPAAFEDWATRWRQRLAAEGGDPAMRREAMRRANPAFIPRNHLVEEAIAAAVRADDLAPFETLVAVLARPFDDQPDQERYALPPRPEEEVHRTFCGT